MNGPSQKSRKKMRLKAVALKKRGGKGNNKCRDRSRSYRLGKGGEGKEEDSLANARELGRHEIGLPVKRTPVFLRDLKSPPQPKGKVAFSLFGRTGGESFMIRMNLPGIRQLLSRNPQGKSKKIHIKQQSSRHPSQLATSLKNMNSSFLVKRRGTVQVRENTSSDSSDNSPLAKNLSKQYSTECENDRSIYRRGAGSNLLHDKSVHQRRNAGANVFLQPGRSGQHPSMDGEGEIPRTARPSTASSDDEGRTSRGSSDSSGLMVSTVAPAPGGDRPQQQGLAALTPPVIQLSGAAAHTNGAVGRVALVFKKQPGRSIASASLAAPADDERPAPTTAGGGDAARPPPPLPPRPGRRPALSAHGEDAAYLSGAPAPGAAPGAAAGAGAGGREGVDYGEALATTLLLRKRGRRAQAAAADTWLRRFQQPIREKYHVSQSELGRGSYGVVRRCHDRVTGEAYAVKTIIKSKVRNPTRLRREIDVMATLDHPNIVRLHEVYEDERFLHLIAPLYTGGDLFKRVRATRRFPAAAAARVLRQLLDAVAYCHGNGVAHRDLKPENLVFESEDPNAPVKVIDFGLAMVDVVGKENDPMSSLVGTPYFIDPEVLRRRFSKKCDVWSAGVILYILLCGYPPFMGDTDADIFQAILHNPVPFLEEDWAGVPPQARELVLWMLQKDSSRRPSAEAALAHAFFDADLPTAASPPGSPAGSPNAAAAAVAGRYAATSFLAARFQQHALRTKLQKLAVNLIAHKLTAAEVAHLRLCFEGLDRSGDGRLSLGELRGFLERVGVNGSASPASSSPAGGGTPGGGGGGGAAATPDAGHREARELFAEVDANRDLEVDLDEFLAATVDRCLCIQEENVQAAFHALDADRSGDISAAELAAHFGSFQHAQAAIGVHDLDCDGRLSLAEFRAMLLAS